jgi:hypothetical protein
MTPYSLYLHARAGMGCHDDATTADVDRDVVRRSAPEHEIAWLQPRQRNLPALMLLGARVMRQPDADPTPGPHRQA